SAKIKEKSLVGDHQALLRCSTSPHRHPVGGLASSRWFGGCGPAGQVLALWPSSPHREQRDDLFDLSVMPNKDHSSFSISSRCRIRSFTCAILLSISIRTSPTRCDAPSVEHPKDRQNVQHASRRKQASSYALRCAVFTSCCSR